MDMSQLRYFCAVADKNSITHASKELHITQSALSTSMQRMEQELGVLLFDRVGKKIILNGQGSVFYRHAKAILREYESACREVQEPCEEPGGVLTIGCTETNFPEKLTTGFKMEHPQILLRQVLLTEELGMGEALDYDFILSCFPTEDTKLSCQRIWEENMFLVLPAAHPLSEQFFLRMEMLQEEPFVTLPPEYEGRRYLEALCSQAGFTPRIGIECLQHHIPAMVEKGFGIAVFPEHAVRSGRLPDNLRIVPIVNEYSHRVIYLLRQKEKHLQPAAQTYLNYLAEILPLKLLQEN